MTDLSTAKHRLDALGALFTALNAHDDVPASYQPYFERVLSALSKRVTREALSPPSE